MEKIKISLDKIVIEYTKISVDFFNQYFEKGVCIYYGAEHTIGNYGYYYELHLKENNNAYLHIYYKLIYQKKSKYYPLRIKTHPKYLHNFEHILKRLRMEADEINFILCDVAYDIPYSMQNIFVASNTGRCMNLYEGTKYFGNKRQRTQHGYCKVYDKNEEQKKKKGQKMAGELTRVEITYRETIPINKLVLYPPKFNKLYTSNVITDTKDVKPEYRAIIYALQSEYMTMDDFSYHYKNKIKQALSTQYIVDFDTLAEQSWEEMVSEILKLVAFNMLPF